MIKKIIFIFILGILLYAIFWFCSNKRIPFEVYGGVTKVFDIRDVKYNLSEPVPDSISMVEYKYDKLTKKLLLKHYNAGFYCCPLDISADVHIKGNVITIKEKQGLKDRCRCSGLFNVEIELHNVKARSYKIVFDEEYARDPKIAFEIDLKKIEEGSYKVIKFGSPWHSKSRDILNKSQKK